MKPGSLDSFSNASGCGASIAGVGCGSMRRSITNPAVALYPTQVAVMRTVSKPMTNDPPQ